MAFDGTPQILSDWELRLADRIAYWREWLEDARALGDEPIATVDFEGRSTVDLIKRGGWLYSKHESTEALCLAYLLPNREATLENVGLWHMAHEHLLIAESEPPEDLFAFILAGGCVEAHNAFFERCMWRHVMVARYGWPDVPHLQWRCSAAKASAASLPRALEDACDALDLPVKKDMVGNRIMRKLMKPKKPTKAERAKLKAEGLDPDTTILWHEDEDDIVYNWLYCKRDVLAEHALSRAVPNLSSSELLVWQLDQKMNERGAKFDLAFARAALDMAAKWRAKLNAELEIITRPEPSADEENPVGILSATKRQAVKAWLLDYEQIDLPDTAADTLDWILSAAKADKLDISSRARRIIDIMKQVNRTSTKKYESMLQRADVDWRIRDLLMYHGASTGRWAGKGVQVHNFPKGKLKDMDEAVMDIMTGDVDWVEAMYGDVMETLSWALRGAIIPEDGRYMMVADYAAIEARCVLWLSASIEALNVFRRGEDIYCDMASGIYGYKVTKKEHPDERQFGKQAILGLGYGMGYITFLLTCRRYDIHFSREQVERIMGKKRLAEVEAWVLNQLFPSDDADKSERRLASKTRRRLVDAREDPRMILHELALMKHTVEVYRKRYPQVKQMWKDQEAAAIAAVQSPGQRVSCGKVTWFVRGRFLHCELPSGRLLSYCDPVVKPHKTSWGELRPHLSYMSVNAVTKRWERTGTYGGKIVENITQAVARDAMADAMVLADQDDTYMVVLSVHDELVAEVDNNKGSTDDFERLMSSIGPWADGCPITAEAKPMKRYRK
jgi:DNA polymerase